MEVAKIVSAWRLVVLTVTFQVTESPSLTMIKKEFFII
nr:MAG TPA: hypothetical protein [Caudoviricetes sp.]